MCGMYVFMFNERILVRNVGLRARAYCLKNEIHQEQQQQRKKKYMIKLRSKERRNRIKKKQNSFNQLLKSTNQTNNITMATKKKRRKKKKERKKKLMRTTIATPDYRQCSMYQYDEGDRLLALVYHSFWHTYFDKLPLFTHFNKRDSHIPVLFGYLHIMLIFCFAFFFCLTSIFHFDNL